MIKSITKESYMKRLLLISIAAGDLLVVPHAFAAPHSIA